MPPEETRLALKPTLLSANANSTFRPSETARYAKVFIGFTQFLLGPVSSPVNCVGDAVVANVFEAEI